MSTFSVAKGMTSEWFSMPEEKLNAALFAPWFSLAELYGPHGRPSATTALTMTTERNVLQLGCIEDLRPYCGVDRSTSIPKARLQPNSVLWNVFTRPKQWIATVTPPVSSRCRAADNVGHRGRTYSIGSVELTAWDPTIAQMCRGYRSVGQENRGGHSFVR
jgi:hypothetical protein